MNLSIKGKLSKVNDEWVSEFIHLNIQIKAPTPFKAVQAVTKFIMDQLDGKDNKCSIRVAEDGVFYLCMNRPRPLVKFIALCLTKNYSDKTQEQLSEWFRVEDEA
ncbi:MAG TPA: hypothetical protein VNJ08_14495 [Bacteriovoracaceae bacterium]|nr:hypothetical protein [Bacteriovoracaceae bacterium]